MPHLALEDGKPVRAPRDRRSAEPLAQFLEGVQAQVESLMRAHGLEAAEAEEILRATVRTLVWKWESVRDRESWLLAVLARRCQQASALHRLGDPP